MLEGALGLYTLTTSNIIQRSSYVKKALDEPLIKVGKAKDVKIIDDGLGFYFSLVIFILFYFYFSFHFLYLEQLGLGLISHTVTSVTT